MQQAEPEVDPVTEILILLGVPGEELAQFSSCHYLSRRRQPARIESAYIDKRRAHIYSRYVSRHYARLTHPR